MDYNTNNISSSESNLHTSSGLFDDDHHPAPSLVSKLHPVPPSRSKAGVTPMAIIVTRNVQKFFANKLLQQQQQNKNSKTKGSSSVDNGDDRNQEASTMDVCAVLHDVDEILDHRSIEDGRLLLRGMVADLLKEIDLVRYKYDTLHTQYVHTKEERDLINHIYNDKIDALTIAVRNAVHQSSGPAKHHLSTGTSKSTSENESVLLLAQEMKEQMEQGTIVSADTATTLTIQSLIAKIESLHITTLQQQETMQQLREQMEDVISDNDAKTYKIMALEKQFTNINKKRTKINTKFGTHHITTTNTAKTSGVHHDAMNTTSSNTSMIVRPIRIIPPPPIVLVNDDATNDTEVGTTAPPNDKHDENDYNSIYQDHEDNILANIMNSMNSPNTMKTTTTSNESPVVVAVAEDTPPTMPTMTVDDDKVPVENVTATMDNNDDDGNRKNEDKKVVVRSNTKNVDAITTYDTIVDAMKIPTAMTTTTLDVRDDTEVGNDDGNNKENTSVSRPNVVVPKMVSSPFAAIFQAKLSSSSYKNSCLATPSPPLLDMETTMATPNVMVITPPTTPVGATKTTITLPPPIQQAKEKKTITILGDVSNHYTTTGSHGNSRTKSSKYHNDTTTTIKKKTHHSQQRGPRLVQLVEQI